MIGYNDKGSTWGARALINCIKNLDVKLSRMTTQAHGADGQLDS